MKDDCNHLFRSPKQLNMHFKIKYTSILVDNSQQKNFKVSVTFHSMNGMVNPELQQTLPREASQRTSMFFSSSLMVHTHKISYHYARKEGQAKLKSMKNHPTNTRKDES